MRFAEIIGNESLKDALVRMARSGRLGHALLLTEENGGGAFALALALAQFVNCREPQENDSCGVCGSCHKYGKLIHPDLHFVFPVSASTALSESEKKGPISDYFLPAFRELALANPYFTEQQLYDAIGIENKSGLISVNEAKRIAEKLLLRAAEGNWKTMIIYLPEKMNAEAANKLLKLLEEPPETSFICLIAEDEYKLLPTIRNRCVKWQFKRYTREQLETITSNEHVLKYARTPGQIEKYSKSKVDGIEELCEKMFTVIHSAIVPNALSISSKIAW